MKQIQIITGYIVADQNKTIWSSAGPLRLKFDPSASTAKTTGSFEPLDDVTIGFYDRLDIGVVTELRRRIFPKISVFKIEVPDNQLTPVRANFYSVAIQAIDSSKTRQLNHADIIVGLLDSRLSEARNLGLQILNYPGIPSDVQMAVFCILNPNDQEARTAALAKPNQSLLDLIRTQTIIRSTTVAFAN